MFRFLSKQAAGAVRRPSLLISTSRHVYDGPPSYDMITRRFSSQVNSKAHKETKETKERGQYVDLHDIGGVDPMDYDVLISDVTHEKLRDEVAGMVGIQYHAKATKEDANKVVEIGDCYIYGRKFRTIFPAVVDGGSQAYWGFFIVHSGSPLTYLSTQTCDLLNITAEEIGPTHVKIAGYHHAVYRSPDHLHFTGVNLLGMDFFNLYNVSQWNDFKRARAKLFFGRDWELPVKKSNYSFASDKRRRPDLPHCLSLLTPGGVASYKS